MGTLILGLIVFLGMHSLRLVAEPWRNANFARLGETRWKGLYSIVSIAGFVLIVVGYGMARRAPVVLWAPPSGVRHLTALIVAVAFVLIAAAYVPGSRIKRIVGHPMYAGIALWAVGHLLANGTLQALVLFGAFFVWATAGLLVWRHRDRLAHVRYAAGSAAGDLRAGAVGLVAWALFAFLLHGWLIGVRPLA
ncbi:MAG TPA: NnrU family protein [Trinickia sp.]|uniref:NnrU family protein n=1 Tax=Trinickia sp. TaxID=2571163 RepID=UPI002F406421